MEVFDLSVFYSELRTKFKYANHLEIINYFELMFNRVNIDKNVTGIISVGNEYASYLRFVGEIDKSYCIYDQVLKLVLEVYGNHSSEYVSVLLNLGDVDIVAGNFWQAISRFNTAENLINEHKYNYYLLATVYNNRASAYKGLLQFKEAEADIIKALSLIDNKLDKQLISRINLVEIYILWGKFDKAEKNILDVLKTYSEFGLETDVHYLNALACAGELYFYLGQYQKSYEYYSLVEQKMDNKFEQTHIHKMIIKNLEKVKKLI